MATKKTETKESQPAYYATEDFYDSYGDRLYKAGKQYTETSKERTAALLEGKVSELNKIGRIYLSTKKPEEK